CRRTPTTSGPGAAGAICCARSRSMTTSRACACAAPAGGRSRYPTRSFAGWFGLFIISPTKPSRWPATALFNPAVPAPDADASDLLFVDRRPSPTCGWPCGSVTPDVGALALVARRSKIAKNLASLAGAERLPGFPGDTVADEAPAAVTQQHVH